MNHSNMAQPQQNNGPTDGARDDARIDARREQDTQMARAVEANWGAAWASLGQLRHEPRSLVEDTPTMLRVVTPGLPETLMNMVMRYRAPAPVTAATIEDVIARFRRYGLPFQWWLIRDDAPTGLREQLYAVGMRSWGGATMMYLPLSHWNPSDPGYPLAPPEVSYHRLTTAAELSDALRIISRVFDVPPYPMSRWTNENPAFTSIRRTGEISPSPPWRPCQRARPSASTMWRPFRRRGGAASRGICCSLRCATPRRRAMAPPHSPRRQSGSNSIRNWVFAPAACWNSG